MRALALEVLVFGVLFFLCGIYFLPTNLGFHFGHISRIQDTATAGRQIASSASQIPAISLFLCKRHTENIPERLHRVCSIVRRILL